MWFGIEEYDIPVQLWLFWQQLKKKKNINIKEMFIIHGRGI